MRLEGREMALVVDALRRAGCVAAAEEAEELIACAPDRGQLTALLGRRVSGEPLAWVTGRAVFCGLSLRVRPGVYVPRWQSEPLAERAARRLPAGGRGLDLCTGSGALAAVMAARVPTATVMAVDVSPVAVACARANGVDARVGDLDEPVPPSWAGLVDVLSAVPPYVPSGALGRLPRDSIDHEPRMALDGGPDGLGCLSRIVELAPRWLRPGVGVLLLELGGDQATLLGPQLARAGFGVVEEIPDEDGDVRGVEARLVS